MKKILALALALIMVLCASAVAEGSLVLYDSHASDWSDPIIKAFAEKYAYATWGKVDEDHTAVRFCTSWCTKLEDAEALAKDILEF